MVVDRMTRLQSTLLRKDKIVIVRHGHMTILAGLTSLRVAVGTVQPFAIGIIDDDASSDLA
jgi:hypothetical protein